MFEHVIPEEVGIPSEKIHEFIKETLGDTNGTIPEKESGKN